MTIILPPTLEKRLHDEAAKRGVTIDKLAAEMIDRSLPPAPLQRMAVQQSPSLHDLFSQWEREDATDDPEEIARRIADFEEFKRGMNESRLLSEGPIARIPYP